VDERAPDIFGWVGQVLDGKYRIDAAVGEGGFGIVYRAFHLGLQEPVAVKCLKIPSNLSESARKQLEESFLAEGRLLHRLSRGHSGIAQALDVGAAVSPSGVWTPYLVLEWLEGCSLDAELARARASGLGAATLEEAARLMLPVMDAVGEAHDQGVAHRDLKPANLFLAHVGGKPVTKVLDFGVAKLMSQTATLTCALESTGGAIRAFTPLYGAPEQFDARHGATGPWTDVFALALIFVELVVGRPALEGQDTVQLFVACSNPLERPTPRRKGVMIPDGVNAVLERALSVSPRDRFRTAREFADALRASLAETASSQPLGNAQTVRAPPPPLGALSLPNVTVPASAGPLPGVLGLPGQSPSTTSPLHYRSSAQRAPKGDTRAATVIVLAGVVGLIAVVAGGAVIWRSYGNSTEGTPPLPTASSEPGSSPSPPRRAPGVAATDMKRMGPGTFEMGSRNGSSFERPHAVTISRGFFIDVTEVTVAQYLDCVDAGRCTAPSLHGAGNSERDAGGMCNSSDAARRSHPVNCVDRYQAESYCRFVRKRLPTEAEWEYAARGSSARRYPWGNASPTCDHAVIDRGAAGDCRGRPHGTMPVGSLPAGQTVSGLLDMAGNVREWVADGWQDLPYAGHDVMDPLVPAEGHSVGVVRGGAWDSPMADAAAWRRVKLGMSVGDPSTGFRCARSEE